MHQLKGSGLPNVQLAGGYAIDESDGSVAYSDLKGLYHAIALAISCRGADVTPAEFRFLRKRLGKSQLDVGVAMGYCDDQSVAKWEKGTSPIPLVVGWTLRWTWLSKHAKKNVARSMEKMWNASQFVRHGYVFDYVDGKWLDVSHKHAFQPIRATAEEETSALIHAVRVRPSLTTLTMGVSKTNFIVPATS